MEPTPTQKSNKGLFASIVSVLVLIAAFIGISTIKTEEVSRTDEESPANTDNTSAPAPTEQATTTPTPTTSTSTTIIYKDGTYAAKGLYTSPAGDESIDIRLTIKNDAVADVSVTPMATNIKSIQYQNKFISGIKAQTVGKKIDSLQVDHVSGSSLTPEGFNNALIKIKAEARI